MNIKSITLVTTAEAVTSHGKYHIEYTLLNDVLERVHTAIYVNDADSGEMYVGSISYENETLSCSLPVQSKVAGYFEDFDRFLEQIKFGITGGE
ncbi:hypothetical protein [Bacteroides sp. 51]|uniref:hypothetical protein n=1 Tax=Bacteroides sp. 51 TaxID=2302938 RepID=UPI0013D21326|nr:hypothetical protein [Bacteroides sp. 51]NDV80842.1 hypothetical protein [Bacteroides sp. 51]